MWEPSSRDTDGDSDGDLDREDEVVVRSSKTGMISWMRFSAEVRAMLDWVGGGGRVDLWSCLARMRARRLVARVVVVVAAVVVVVAGGFWAQDDDVEVDFEQEEEEEDFCCARMAPALRSSRRCWPLARRGEIFNSEVHSVIGARGSCDVNVVSRAAAGVGLRILQFFSW